MAKDRKKGSGGSSRNEDAEKRLPEEGRAFLNEWRRGLILQDHRYNNKGLLQLVSRAMVDEEFRSRLLKDADGLLRDFSPKLEPMPQGVTIKFLENSGTVLNVVLPPRVGDIDYRPLLRDLLRSRTSSTIAASVDDYDFGNVFPADANDHGDPGGGDVVGPLADDSVTI